MERPAQHERERDQPDTGDVGAMIEARHARARRHRDPELLPEPLAAELQLLDRGREHVLDDHQARVRRHHEPLGCDQAVRDLARVLVQERNRRDQLTNEAERGVDVELQVPLVRDAQDVGQPGAFDVVRHDREPGAGHLHAVDAPHARVVGMAEVGQAGGALAQRELERRHRRERGTNAENLQQFAGRAVSGDDALAQAVAEEWSFGPFVRREVRLSWSSALARCNHRTTPHTFSRIRRKSLKPRPSGAFPVCMCEHTDLRGCRATFGFVTGNWWRTTLMLALCEFWNAWLCRRGLWALGFRL